jgi:octaprenyl-diphosphate synthase
MEQIRATLASEIEAVNQLIIEQLQSNVPMVENIGHYIVDAGGKRLRPLLVLLSAAAQGLRGETQVRYAAVIEFIHTATLLHDDVVDISALRRGRPTANAEFGNAPSVLVGDFLYTRAFQLLVQLEDMDILRHMADTTNTIAEGEVLQLTRAGDATTTEEQYLDVITRKTAILFGAACYGASVLAGADEQARLQQQAFGLNLGIAFQMIDDVLDYAGNPEAMGKNVGDDLTEGKSTLPLIYTLQHGTAPEQSLVRDAITNKSAEHIDDIITAVKRCGALDYTYGRARHYHDLALLNLEHLPANSYRTSMAQITAMAINRDH